MMDDESQAPQPRNPYSRFAIWLIILGVAALISIMLSGMGSSARPNLALFLPGLIVLTMTVILGVGVIYGWLGFNKRFGSGQILGYWKIEGGDWKEHLEREKKRLLFRALAVGVGLPAVIVSAMLYLAYSDGRLGDVVPVAMSISGLVALVIGIVVAIQWFSMKGDVGHVWLSRNGIMVNRIVFFVDGYGINTLSREVRKENGKFILSIRYRVRSNKTVVDKELLVPVPEKQLALVSNTTEMWNA